jgi:hypothetical protein
MGGVGGETRSTAGVAAAGGSDLLRRLRDADGSEREEMGRLERVRSGEAEISERDRSAKRARASWPAVAALKAPPGVMRRHCHRRRRKRASDEMGERRGGAASSRGGRPRSTSPLRGGVHGRLVGTNRWRRARAICGVGVGRPSPPPSPPPLTVATSRRGRPRSTSLSAGRGAALGATDLGGG